MRTTGLGIAVLLAAVACGGGAAGPTTTPPSTPSSTVSSAMVTSLDDATSRTVGSSQAVRNSIILAEAMTAQESADKTHELGLGSIPMIAPVDWTCPDYAGCPYLGEAGSDHGYLIITRLAGAPSVSGNIHVTVNWISDQSSRVTAQDVVLSADKLPRP